MATTFVLLASTTLESSTTSISFQSISQSYTDLELVGALKCDDSTQIKVTYNNTGGTSYNYVDNYGYGSGWQGNYNNSYSGILFPYVSNTFSTTNFIRLNIQRYSAALAYQPTLYRVGNNAHTGRGAAQFVSGGAINRIDISMISGNFTAGTKVSIYGLATS